MEASFICSGALIRVEESQPSVGSVVPSSRTCGRRPNLCDAKVFALPPLLPPATPSHQTHILSVCVPVHLSAAAQQEFDRGICSLGLITAGQFNSVLVHGLCFSKSVFILLQFFVNGKGKMSQCCLCIYIILVSLKLGESKAVQSQKMNSSCWSLYVSSSPLWGCTGLAIAR